MDILYVRTLAHTIIGMSRMKGTFQISFKVKTMWHIQDKANNEVN